VRKDVFVGEKSAHVDFCPFECSQEREALLSILRAVHEVVCETLNSSAVIAERRMVHFRLVTVCIEMRAAGSQLGEDRPVTAAQAFVEL